MPSERVETKLRRLVDLKREKTRATAAEKAANEAYAEEEAATYEELEKELGDVSSITIDLGPGYGKQLFVRNERVYGRVYDKDAALQALDEEALSDELVVSGFNGTPLNQLVQRRIANGQELPDGITFRKRRWIAVSSK